MILGFLLGLVQGLTEFLPISSDGHLVAAQNLTGFTEGMAESSVLLFDVWLHVATLLAILIFFRRPLLELLRQAWNDRHPSPTPLLQRKGLRLILLGSAASLPTAVIGVALKGWVEAHLHSNNPVVIDWAINGALLFLTGRHLASRSPPPIGPSNDRLDFSGLSFTGALLVGIGQGLAVLPGISRSGFTISTLLLLRQPPDRAAFFSFFLAIPAIAGATLLTAIDLPSQPDMDWPTLAVALATAFGVGYLALGWLLKALRSQWFSAFAGYCWAAALLLWWLSP